MSYLWEMIYRFLGVAKNIILFFSESILVRSFKLCMMIFSVVLYTVISVCVVKICTCICVEELKVSERDEEGKRVLTSLMYEVILITCIHKTL